MVAKCLIFRIPVIARCSMSDTLKQGEENQGLNLPRVRGRLVALRPGGGLNGISPNSARPGFHAEFDAANDSRPARPIKVDTRNASRPTSSVSLHRMDASDARARKSMSRDRDVSTSHPWIGNEPLLACQKRWPIGGKGFSFRFR